MPDFRTSSQMPASPVCPRGMASRAGAWLVGFLVAMLLCMGILSGTALAADGIEIQHAHLEKTDEGVRLSAGFSFELGRSLEDALVRGVPLYFTTEVEITRRRWYWFDQRAASASRTVRISYNVLTRQYSAGVVGQLQQSFATLDDALILVQRPSRWIVAERDALKTGETYLVAVKMELDVTQLPKPFQVHALNSSEWQLASDRKVFNYKVE